MALRGQPEGFDRQHRLARKLLGLQMRVAMAFSLPDGDRQNLCGKTVARHPLAGSAREKRIGVMGKDRAEVILLDAPGRHLSRPGVIPPP